MQTAMRPWFNSPNLADTVLHIYDRPSEAHASHADHVKATDARAQLQGTTSLDAFNQTSDQHKQKRTGGQDNKGVGSGFADGDSSCSPSALAAVQQIKTYHAHAVILCGQSQFFKASLSDDWQPAEKSNMPGHAVSCAHARVLDLTIQPDELEAFDTVLRFMYGFDLPAASPANALLLFQCLHLADRFDVPHCVDTLLTSLKTIAASAGVLQHICATPPGVTSRPGYQALFTDCKAAAQKVLSPPVPSGDSALLDACKHFIISTYCDVPAVIRSAQLRQEFRTLPFNAALAWAESDELQVHSENCVVYLLSAWARTVQHYGGQVVTAEQLERLSRQVRVLHLGPAYQHHILPQLSWFKGCNNIAHLPTLLAFKGKDASGQPVFPAVEFNFSAELRAFPKQWVAQPRRQATVSEADQLLTWEVHGEQLQQLYRGQHVYSPPLYLNGLMIRLGARCRAEDGNRLGLYTSVHPEQADGGMVWPAAAAVSFGPLRVAVTNSPDSSAEDVSCDVPQHVRVGAGIQGHADIISMSAPTAAEVLAPYLWEDKLHVQARFTTVDQP